MDGERSQRGAHLTVRVSRELEEKLEMYHKLRHHKSLSQTIKFFLRLGIQSVEMLEKLKENPSIKDSISKEWYSSLKFMISGDILEDEFENISDHDLESAVMYGYIELVNRKKKMETKTFHYKENQIDEHVESIMESRSNHDVESK
jgi:hypothetical protein